MKASIYSASAGSGKTYQLAYKYIHDVIKQPLLYRNILAVTFTNKATEEMKRRILSQLNALANGNKCPYIGQLQQDLGYSPSQIKTKAIEARGLILHDYSRFTVLTIDRFFQRILRAFIQELGIDIDYSLEIDTSPIVTQGADALIEQITTDSSLRQWLMDLVQERIDEGGKWNIRDGILALKEELFKEEARQTLESEHSKEELQRVVREMRGEAEARVKQIRELAEEALAQIGGDCNQFKGKSSSPAHVFRRIKECDKGLPELTKSQIEASDDISKWCGKSDDHLRPLAQKMMERLFQIVTLYKEASSKYNTSRLLSDNYRSFALMYDLYNKTEEICREQNTMLLSQTSKILAEFITQSDAPFIYEKVGNRFSRFMIDEFQDTSRREWNNFLPLLRNTLSQSDTKENPILIVGDIKQSIYRWRGGDWRILHSDVEQDLGEENTRRIDMVDNYRSRPNIVRFNNELIQRIVERENESLNNELEGAKEDNNIDMECYKELHSVIPKAYRDHAQNPRRPEEEGGFIEVVTYRENPPIIERICSAIDKGYSPCDIMILTRTNREAQLVAQQLLEFKSQCSDPLYHFDVMTQEALLIGYAPVSKFIMATLQLALTPTDALSRAIYNQFLGHRYIDTELSQEEIERLHSIRMLSPVEALEMIIMRYDLSSTSSNIAYLQAIHEQVISYCKGRIGDIALFLEWWHERGAKQSLRVESSRTAIEILTIHKAKGLEKRVVIIPYCNWDCNPKASGMNKNFIWSDAGEGLGRLPIEYRSSMEHSDFSADYYRERIYTRIDNINTLYVATTRAVDSLHLMVKVSEKGTARGVGKLILETLPSGYEQTKREELTQYRYSSPTTPIDERHMGREPIIVDQYNSYTPELKLRLPASRYREEGGITPRELGVLMHRAFEEATSRADILKRVESMLSAGNIDKEEQEGLLYAINKSLNNELASEWFDSEWDSVRNESQIITPQAEGISRRPDRVMISGTRAVVVDYKFGEESSKSHHRQIARYMDLLHRMGYTHIEGYVWYLRRGTIESVSQQ